MSKCIQGVLPTSTILVTREKIASEVAKTMIESGNQSEPFCIFDMDVTYNQVAKFRKEMPRVQIFYAMKCNDNSMMIKLAIALDLGFDCASPGEIDKILKHNVRPTSIIYAVPVKTPEEMIFARNSGVKHTTFDSMCELKKFKLYWPDARLLIRIRPESSSWYKLSDKFSCELSEALSLLDEAARLGITVIGVAFHVGSGCLSMLNYTDGLKKARAVFDHEARHGRKMTLLDIGGGFFDFGTETFEEVAKTINCGLNKWFSEPDIQVIAEPGRYMCELAFTFYSNIRNVRTTIEADKALNMIYLNNGKNGMLPFLENWHTVYKFKSTEDICETASPQDTVIWGPTMDEKDFIGPVKLSPCTAHDWLVFCHQGAYSLPFESSFCSMNKTLTRFVASKKLWEILKIKPIFTSASYELDASVPACLPTNMPPLVFDDGEYVHSLSSTIIE